jgi:selenide,water dikinase
MATLNAGAAEAMLRAGVQGATDVTGFGLLGHLREVMEASGTTAVVDVAAVPVIDHIAELVERQVYPGGSERNLASVVAVLDPGEVDETTIRILADAQTSGGLLMAVPPEAVDGLLADLDGRAPCAVVIGEVVRSGDRMLVLR